MMTNYLSNLKTNRFLILFVGSIALYSCGSYQNSSYYDNDGVYGADTSKKVVYQEQTANTSKYAAQFQSMREEYATDETFTDVTTYTTPIDSSKTKSQSYAGWGNNQSNVVVNVYNNNPYWGWNGWYGNAWGWGWNNWYGGYYGNNWGWGWNNWYGGYYGYNWGWGWNNWYGGYYGYYGPYNNWGWNGWYGYGGNHIAYNHGRRGSVSGFANGPDYSSGRHNNSGGGRRSGTSVMEPPRRDASIPRNVVIGQPRSTSTSEPRSTQPRSYSNDTNGTGTPRPNTISQPRTTSQPRTVEPRTTSQPRTVEPRTNSYPSTPRNSDYGGGGRSGGFGGGFGGGGRSGGGGGGRRG